MGRAAGLVGFPHANRKGLTALMRTSRLLGAMMALAFMLPAAAQAAPTYYPSGPQTDVPQSTVSSGGWQVCYSTNYASTVPLSNVLTPCDGDFLIMASVAPGSSDYSLLAAGPRATVLADSGNAGNVTHNANGTEWYFSTGWSWGFALGGDTVNRDSCDYPPTGQPHADLRLCWHTGGGNLSSGFRSGTTNLNGNASWQRVVLENIPVHALGDPNPVNFGNQTLSTTSATKAITYTVSSGPGLPDAQRQLGAAQIVGANASDFSLLDEDCPDAAPDNASTTCTAHVTFSPQASGARTAELQFDNVPNDAVTLNGTGQAVDLSVDPSPYDFGDVPLHGLKSHTFTITNNSDITATVQLGTDGGVGTDANGEDLCSGQDVAPGESCTVLVSYIPDSDNTTLGPRTGHLMVSSTQSPAAADAKTVNLTATVVPDAPSALAEGNDVQYNQDRPVIGVKGARTDATQVALYIDGQLAGTTDTVDADGTAFIQPDQPVSDGDHVLTFSQTAQGYTSPVENDAPVTVKAAAPTVEHPTEGQVVTERTPLLAVSGALSDLPVNYYLDGELLGTENSQPDGAASYQVVDELADGPHTLEVSTVDSTGHEGAKSTLTAFTVDTTGPQTTIDSGPAAGATIADSTPTFEFSSSEPNSTFECQVDDGEPFDCASGLTLDELGPGEHTFSVTATDASGNSDEAPVSRTFSVAGPSVVQPPASTPAPVVVIPTRPASQRCGSRRNFVIHLRPRHKRLVSAVVRFDGKKLRVTRDSSGRLRARVNLTGLTRGFYKVKIVARGKDGKRYKETRTYKTC